MLPLKHFHSEKWSLNHTSSCVHWFYFFFYWSIFASQSVLVSSIQQNESARHIHILPSWTCGHVGAGEDRMNEEIRLDICTLPCVKQIASGNQLYSRRRHTLFLSVHETGYKIRFLSLCTLVISDRWSWETEGEKKSLSSFFITLPFVFALFTIQLQCNA